jgi:hypothetical protein
VLSFVPETKDFTLLDGGWAVEWRTYTLSIGDSPRGEAKQVRGTVLIVLKELPDGSWKCFRAMGSIEPATPGKPVADTNGGWLGLLVPLRPRTGDPTRPRRIVQRSAVSRFT